MAGELTRIARNLAKGKDLMSDETRVLGAYETAPAVRYAVEIDGRRYQALAYSDMPMAELPELADAVHAMSAMQEPDGVEGMQDVVDIYGHMRTLLAAHLPDVPAEVLDRLTPRVAAEMAQALAMLD